MHKVYTKDIWRLESKWSDHDRFWTDHDQKLAEVSSGFFSISLAPTNIVVRVHTKITEKHGKLKEFTEKHGNLCGGESNNKIYRFLWISK